MTRIVPLLTSFFYLSAVFAKPVVKIRENSITVPIAVRINSIGGKNFVDSERARAQQLMAVGHERAAARQARADGGTAKREVINAPITNKAVDYIASVGVGSPPTQYDLVVDTGSSNTWVGAGKTYVRTSTSTSTGNSVSVTYGSGNSSFSGTEFIDQVTLTSGLVISQQSIGVASKSTGVDSVDGILGLGPVDLTKGTVSNTDTVPTVTDNLFSEGTISSNEIGISFEPATSDSEQNGEITFGGTDSSKFTGEINYVPITGTSPASEFWGIDESVNYGGSPILSTTAGIVDTGTTLIMLASDAFSTYQHATGAVPDNSTGLLSVTTDQFSAMKDLNFDIGGTTFALTPDAQIWPRTLNTAIGGNANGIYLIVSDLGTPSGKGLDFINGHAFLERFYSIYDTANSRVGIATTPFTDATTN